jgi:hypothetical protein
MRVGELFRELRGERRCLGWKGLLKRRGVFVALVVGFYLIRDIVLYVLIPLAIAAGLQLVLGRQ